MFAGVAIIFVYIYQLTFFASIMYWTNLREIQNRNCLTFRKIKTKKNCLKNSKYLKKMLRDFTIKLKIGKQFLLKIQSKLSKIFVKIKILVPPSSYIQTIKLNPQKTLEISKCWLTSLSKKNKILENEIEFNESFVKNHIFAKFFYLYYADFILKPITKILIILFYFIYLVKFYLNFIILFRFLLSMVVYN